MSVEAVNQFLQKVTEDEKVQQELATILESQDNDREAAVQLGIKHGYQFTSDELWQEIQNRQSEFLKRQESGQLSDAELESVAGGYEGTSIVGGVIAGTAMATSAITGKAKW